MSAKEAFCSLLGIGSDNSPIIIRVFGYFFTAIIISMIIATFPEERVKKCVKKSKMFVIGCGDVVKNRLYPALCRSEYAYETFLFDINSKNNLGSVCKCCNSDQEIFNAATINNSTNKGTPKIVDANSVVWITTPPDKHISYLEKFVGIKAGLIALEKPIATTREDLEKVKGILGKKREKIFFLSYYVLEKALPLTYLAAIAKGDKGKVKEQIYKKYLDFDETTLIKKWNTILGKLNSINVNIYEGEDNREWVKKGEKGGHLFETFLHNMLVAMIFCPNINEWEKDSFSDADYQKDVHQIWLTAKTKDGISIKLNMEKNSDKRERGATLVFENGTIVADFQKQTACINFNSLSTSCNIRVKDEFKGKYDILTDLVGRVRSSECTSSEIDGLENQIEAIEKLMEWKENPRQQH